MPTASVVVSPGYFRSVGATIVEGRDVQWTDTATSAVVLVNQRFAERHWPNSSPIGQRLRLGPTTPGGTPSEWLTVVGVTSNIVQNDVTRQEFEPVVYVPYGRRPQPNMFAFVRSRAAIGRVCHRHPGVGVRARPQPSIAIARPVRSASESSPHGGATGSSHAGKLLVTCLDLGGSGDVRRHRAGRHQAHA